MTAEHFHTINMITYHHNLEVYQWRYSRGDCILPIFNIEMVEFVRSEAKVSVLCEKLFFDPQEVFDKLSLE